MNHKQNPAHEKNIFFCIVLQIFHAIFYLGSNTTLAILEKESRQQVAHFPQSCQCGIVCLPWHRHTGSGTRNLSFTSLSMDGAIEVKLL
jgi:hypothetical protein